MMQKLKASGQVTVDKATYQDYTIKDLRIHYQYAKGVMKVDPLGLQFSGEGAFTSEGSLKGKLECVAADASTVQRDLKRNGHRKARGKGAIKESVRFSTPLHPYGHLFFKEPWVRSGSCSILM